MPEPGTLLLFALSALVLIAVPGPNLLYIVTRSASEGRRAGLASVFGVETGTLVHIAAAAAGLSALLASSAVAFDAVRYAGAAYLAWLGVRTLRGRGRGAEPDGLAPAAASLAAAYRQGVLVQVLNPKVALFFLALLPQFLDPAAGPLATQVLVLGTVLAVLGSAVGTLYALAAGAAGVWLRARRGVLRRVSGVVYLALGAAAVLGGRQST